MTRIICLCGSVRFKEEFDKANWAFTISGDIVVQPGCWEHAEFHEDNYYSQQMKERLDRLHKAKIDLADMIYIINRGGYIGPSTRSEIEYAESKDKWIVYMEEKVPSTTAGCGSE